MIEIIAFDIDGTLTDGSITYDSKGNEYKTFNAKDGMAISSWVKMGKKAIFISGRKSLSTQIRAKELGITECYCGVKDKRAKIKEVLSKFNIDKNCLAVIGDDINDIGMIQEARLSFAPNDASKDIKDIVDVILSKDGGKGAAREMIEHILTKEHIKNDFLRLWA